MSPSVEHEAFCALFKTADLPLLQALVAPVGIVLPAGAELRDASEESGQVIPTSFVADVVLKIEAGAQSQVLIVEVQRGIDADQRWSWPVYFATMRARHRCGVVLLVVAPEANVAAPVAQADVAPDAGSGICAWVRHDESADFGLDGCTIRARCACLSAADARRSIVVPIDRSVVSPVADGQRSNL